MDVAVGLVKTYLEFAGYFVLTELPIRVKRGARYQDVTDIDIVAVRFAHRTRSSANGDATDILLGDDPQLKSLETGVDVIIGEVKQGKARLNPGLRRTQTVAFALRRTGCCPEADIPARTAEIVRRGSASMALHGGSQCRVRIVAFAGHGVATDGTALTMPLVHCLAFVRDRFRDGGAGLATVHFHDDVTGLLSLLSKLEAGVDSEDVS